MSQCLATQLHLQTAGVPSDLLKLLCLVSVIKGTY